MSKRGLRAAKWVSLFRVSSFCSAVAVFGNNPSVLGRVNEDRYVSARTDTCVRLAVPQAPVFLPHLFSVCLVLKT